MALLTVAELDDFLDSPLSAKHTATKLDRIIGIVSERVQNWCGVEFEPMLITDERVSPWISSAQVIFKPSSVPRTITAANWLYGADFTRYPMVMTDAVIENTSGFVYIQGDVAWPYAPVRDLLDLNPSPIILLASYTTGDAEIPDAVKLATALLVQEHINMLRELKRGRPAPLQSFRTLNYSETYAVGRIGKDGGLGYGTPLAEAAMLHLKHYRSAPITFTGSV